jgi:MFS superfamily sulfate permease-like transporter
MAIMRASGFRKIRSVGKDQLLIFAVTIAGTLLYTDLLLGIAIGLLTKVALLCFQLIQSSLKQGRNARISVRQSVRLMWAALAELFMSPVIRVDIGDGRGARSGMSAGDSVKRGLAGKINGSCHIHLSSLTCTNLIKLDEALSKIPPGRHATIVVNVSGRIIDHTSMEYLHHFQEQCLQAGHSCRIVGVEKFHAFSDHALSTRMNHWPVQALAIE